MPDHSDIPSVPGDPFVPDRRQGSKEIRQGLQEGDFETASSLDDISPVSLLLPVH